MPNANINSYTPYVSSASQNCQRQDYLPVTNDSFSATLGGKSVTTFVSDDATKVEGDASNPVSFTLHQNYPNPFNPTTTIPFELNQNDHIRISLVDITGREIKTIVKGDYNSGSHTVTFDAGHLASGVYFYKMETSHFTALKKLAVVR